LKISEGCNHRCSFCIIPRLRGDLVSRSAADVLGEAERLVRAGVRELLVISQDTSAYGVDIKYREAQWRGRSVAARITDLSAALGELGAWVRLHYVYPYPHVDDLIPLMAAGKVLPYLDVPFQHASPKILKSMKRPAAEAKTLQRIREWRAAVPELTIRSTFIVGFPGETEQDFQTLLDWLEEAELDRVGCFRYEPVHKAAANALPNAVPEELKEERWHRFMAAQQVISARRLARRVGTDIDVIIDELDGDHSLGRSMAYAPEIEGSVYLPSAKGAKKLQTGSIVMARVTLADDYDLWAVPVG
jgi:ribosomal protein S12 methylthiotransferase